MIRSSLQSLVLIAAVAAAAIYPAAAQAGGNHGNHHGNHHHHSNNSFHIQPFPFPNQHHHHHHHGHVPIVYPIVPVYSQPRVVTRTVVVRPPQNIVPVIVEKPAVSAGKIKLRNPADSGGAIRYLLNDQEFVIEPGFAQQIEADRDWVIEFTSGGSKGDVRYRLAPGEYEFRAGDDGWDLAKMGRKAVKADAPAPPTREEE
jgi:hypothetical protein